MADETSDKDPAAESFLDKRVKGGPRDDMEVLSSAISDLIVITLQINANLRMLLSETRGVTPVAERLIKESCSAVSTRAEAMIAALEVWKGRHG